MKRDYFSGTHSILNCIESKRNAYKRILYRNYGILYDTEEIKESEDNMNKNKYNFTLEEMRKLVDTEYLLNRNDLIRKVNEYCKKLDALQISNLKKRLNGKIVGE